MISRIRVICCVYTFFIVATSARVSTDICTVDIELAFSASFVRTVYTRLFTVAAQSIILRTQHQRLLVCCHNSLFLQGIKKLYNPIFIHNKTVF